MHILQYHLLAALGLAVLLGMWFYPGLATPQQQLLLLTALFFAISIAVQMVLQRQQVAPPIRWGTLYASDILLTGLILYATGGIDSPFSLLYGLIIIASGTHSIRIFPILTSILGCISYLLAVYSNAYLVTQISFSPAQALQLLMQTSALLLIGGVIAYIAQRQAALQQESRSAIRQQHRLTELHNSIMREMHEGVIVLDQRQQVRDLNNAARDLIDREELTRLLGQPPLSEFLARPDADSMQYEYPLNDHRLLITIRQLHQHKDAAWLLTIVDISHIRQLERQLLEQEKMAALGEMAAMLAHEIRNPINTMSQSLELISKAPEKSGALQSIMQEEFQRLNRLVCTMLEYARPLQPQPGICRPAELIHASIQQSAPDCATGIEVACDIDRLRLDPDHFRIVIDNLIINALQNRQPDTPITIRLQGEEENWSLSVCNHGNIPAAMVEKIFQPFVSGRAQGVGLGLATVRQICAINRWRIELQQSGKLVCFTLHAAEGAAHG